MDPATMMVMSAATSAVATGVSAISSYQTANAQADQQTRVAEANAKIAEVRQHEEMASAQSQSQAESLKKRLAQSRLTTLAGASGSGVDDPTIKDLYGDLEQVGDTNAARALAEGEARSRAIGYQSQLDRWNADSEARIRRAGGKATLLGGLLKATGEGMRGYASFKTPMGERYGSYYDSRSTGYAR